MLVVFIYVIIGFGTYRIGVFNDDSIKHIAAFVVKICCPALTISTVAGAELKPSLIGDTVFMLVGIFAVFFLLTLLALWISRRMRGIDKFDANVYALGMTTKNSGFMGFPVTQSVFGPMAFYFMVIADMPVQWSSDSGLCDEHLRHYRTGNYSDFDDSCWHSARLIESGVGC